MARIVFAWEFGAGMGHTQSILPLAKEMQQRGYEVICLMRDVISSEKILGRHNIAILQAPVWSIKVNPFPTHNYAEILFNLGYLVPGALLSMAKAWRNLFSHIRPDLIMFEYAPTALVATHGSEYRRVLWGTGFFVPPPKYPMPSINPYRKSTNEQLQHSEKKLLHTINGTLKELGAPLLEHLYDLFAVDESILATFKELDHYKEREPTKYWGPILSIPEGERAQWPETGKSHKRIFCYLKPGFPLVEPVLEDLQRIEASVLVYMPNLPKGLGERIKSPNISFLEKPADMHAVCSACDLVICHAGHGTCAIALLHGIPLLLLPEKYQLEQFLLGYNLVKAKLGIMVTASLQKGAFAEVIEQLLTDPAYRHNAGDIAGKYKNFDAVMQVKEIVDRCEEVLQA